jgi:hypothetical protein
VKLREKNPGQLFPERENIEHGNKFETWSKFHKKPTCSEFLETSFSPGLPSRMAWGPWLQDDTICFLARSWLRMSSLPRTRIAPTDSVSRWGLVIVDTLPVGIWEFWLGRGSQKQSLLRY